MIEYLSRKQIKVVGESCRERPELGQGKLPQPEVFGVRGKREPLRAAVWSRPPCSVAVSETEVGP